MKKLLLIILCLFCLVGCTNKEEKIVKDAETEETKLQKLVHQRNLLKNTNIFMLRKQNVIKMVKAQLSLI